MTPSRLFPKFKDLAREGQQLGQEVERGQASTPLADHCAQILDDLIYRAQTVALVATSSQARSQALHWMLGEEHQGVSMQLSRLGGNDGPVDRPRRRRSLGVRT